MQTPFAAQDKPLVWLHGEIRTPPFSRAARIEAGVLLRMLQAGVKLQMPDSRPMPTIGPRCHELRLDDESVSWRIVYRIDRDAIVILDVFSKQSQRTPKHILQTCRRRLVRYDSAVRDI
jgi:phage-related protein